MPVLIAILAHNNLPLTKACVKSALAQEYIGAPYPGAIPDSPHFGVIVLDNASTDSTPQWLMSMAPVRHFSTMLFRERQSVAACWNHILDWAFSPVNPNHYEGVLVLNNDTQIRPDTLQWLMRDPAPFTTAISVRTEGELGYPAPPTSRRPHPDFSCFMIKPICWRKVGRFDECFEGAYCEDASYHIRMHMADVPAICLDLPFLHYGSGTLKSADPTEKRRIERQAEKNREIFADMYGCEPGSAGYQAIFAEGAI